MGKMTIVPEEIRRAMVADYLSGTKSLKEVGQPYHYGYDVVRRIMVEENIEIKARKTKPPRIFSQEEIDEIIEEYTIKLYPLTKITKIHHTEDKKIKKVLIDNNIHIRSDKENRELFSENRTYKVNDQYFSTITPNSAWLIGFLAADGYLPKNNNRIILSLQRRDREILEKIKEEINFEGSVYDFMDHGFEKSSISFSSKQMRKDLEQYGIVNNKTDKVFFPKELLSTELLLHFLRGYWDGDGSIYEPSDSHKISMNLVSINEQFIQDVDNFLEEEYNIPKVTVHKRMDYNSTRYLYYITYRTNSSFKLGHLFYVNDLLGLQRKKDKYFNICEKYSHNK